GRELQLPARARDGDGPRSRVRDRRLGPWLRRLRAHPGPRLAAPDPLARGDCARPLRRALARRLARGTVAPPGVACPDREGRGAGLVADGRLGARVLPLPGELRRGARDALPRPDALGAVHPRLPRARDVVRRAVDPRDQERDEGRGARRRELEGRSGAGPARDQLPLRGGAANRGRPRRLQERRQGDRVPARVLDYLHGQAVPHRGGLLVPHPLQSLAWGGERVRRRVGRLSAVPRGADRARRRATRTSASWLRAGHRPRSPGAATTAPAASGWLATAPRSGSRRASRVPT